MSTFAVSIYDNNVADISISASVVAVNDRSNYDTSTESGHLQANFSDYKKIKIVTPANQVYLFSTLAGGDVLIDTPDGATLPIETLYTSVGDGVYTLYLIAVPTWSSAASYTVLAGHYVWYDEKLYQAILDSTNQNPSTATTYWTEVTDDDLPVKYRLEQKFVVTCDLEICYQKMGYAVSCLIDVNCPPDLCKSTLYNQWSQLDIILEHIQTLVDNQEWDKVQDMVNLGSSICGCYNEGNTTCNCKN